MSPDFCLIAASWFPTTIGAWQTIALVFLCGISLFLWLESGASDEGREFWRPVPQRTIEPLGLLELFLAFASLRLGLALCEAFFPLAPDTSRGWMIGVGSLLGCCLGFALLLPQSRWIRNWLLVTPEVWVRECVTGVKRILLIMPWLLIFHGGLSRLIPYHHPTLESLEQSITPSDHLAQWFGAGLVAPFTEEFFYRAVLLYWIVGLHPDWRAKTRNLVGDLILGNLVRITPLGRALSESEPTDARTTHRQPGLMLGIFVVSIVFGAAHYNQGAAPISLFILSVFLCWLFVKSRSLWPCIAAHAFFNGYTLFWKSLESLWPVS
ncbi:MAG: CPBP family intramembrane metalloprotease [Pirellulaceae bacterium]|jgi:hypothetical protein|nr:CPBP family intramembrane metalloprotease [Pirellulaceae bacterium]